MQRLNLTLPVSLVVFAIWLGLTLGVAQLLSQGHQAPIADTVGHGVGPAWVLAVVFLVGVTLFSGGKAVGLQAPRPLKSLWLLWLPVLYLAIMLTVVLVKGFPKPETVLFVAVNTALVGISEELMCRGILFRGLLTRFSIWPALLLSSLAFGLMHVLNVFLTGQLQEALLQASAAFMLGLGYMAIRIRTRSLYPMIIVHALWDFLAFMMVFGTSSGPASPMADSTRAFAALLMGVPLFLYGLFLLRNVHTDYADLSARTVAVVPESPKVSEVQT